MAIDQTEANQTATERLNISAKTLGKAMLNSEAYNNFHKAREQFRIDESAKEAARQYNTILSDFQKRAQYGLITPEDERKVEDAHKTAMENKVLYDYSTAQKKLMDFYQEINTYLSEKLKFNFAALAKPESSCCG